MLFIDPNDTNVAQAKIAFTKAVNCRVSRKLFRGYSCGDGNCDICNSQGYRFLSNSAITKRLKYFLNKDNNLLNIISGTPKEIITLENSLNKAVLPATEYKKLTEYWDCYTTEERKRNYQKIYNFYSDIKKIFDYDWLGKLEPDYQFSLYHLAETLNRRSCTYCNRMYTTTMVKEGRKKMMRPQFDHWFPKSQFPLLSTSFHNLIPSCTVCNSASKKDVILSLDDHIHPYVDENQINDFAFSYTISNKKKYHIYVYSKNSNLKALKTIKKLNIDRMYNSHIEEVEELIKVKKVYSEDYLDRMIKLFPKAGLNKKEIYKLVFGVEFETNKFKDKPLSKFKSDLLKELGIID